MEFKRARTGAQIEERRKEIIAAAAELLDLGNIDDVHFKAIGEITSFGRSTIYKYYSTKEEILLDILLEDVNGFTDDIVDFTNQFEKLSRETFSIEMTKIYCNKDRMLKLMSLLYSILEKNSSLEKLTEFKRNIIGFTDPFYNCIQKFFPNATNESILNFIHASSSYILGLYPSTHLTEKQKEAIQLSGYNHRPVDFRAMCYKGIWLLSAELEDPSK